MAGKADFTEQEWETMHKGVAGAGLLVSISDRGFFDSFKEAGALAKHLAEARRDGTNQLVQELAETRGTGFGITSSPDDVETQTLADLRAATATLQSKAPDDLAAYRAFVLDVAQSVADAAGGGETAEAAALAKIRSALDSPPVA